jgi:hypothetical protein
VAEVVVASEVVEDVAVLMVEMVKTVAPQRQPSRVDRQLHKRANRRRV